MCSFPFLCTSASVKRSMNKVRNVLLSRSFFLSISNEWYESTCTAPGPLQGTDATSDVSDVLEVESVKSLKNREKNRNQSKGINLSLYGHKVQRNKCISARILQQRLIEDELRTRSRRRSYVSHVFTSSMQLCLLHGNQHRTKFRSQFAKNAFDRKSRKEER